MRSIIIIDGQDKKKKKLKWVAEQGLSNFYISLKNIKKLYYKPEYRKKIGDILIRSRDDAAYQHFIELLCYRLDSGLLVVIDVGTESIKPIECLATIYGYTIFHWSDFPNYNSVIRYWYEKCNKKYIRKIPNESSILNISDIHSNYNLASKIKLSDTNIWHGDYIDGPEKGGSRRMIDAIIKDSNENNIYLEGNHELRLRKYLGSAWLNNTRKTIAYVLRANLPVNFLTTTVLEFKDVANDAAMAKNYLDRLNEKLQEFVAIVWRNKRIYCTHSGLKWKEQLTPKYIGNVIYGGKNIENTDREFLRDSVERSGGSYWSVHAHCHYKNLKPRKWPGIINIDPASENFINYMVNLGQVHTLERIKKE